MAAKIVASLLGLLLDGALYSFSLQIETLVPGARANVTSD